MHFCNTVRARRLGFSAIALVLLATLGGTDVAAQQPLTLFITAVDAAGAPVADLKAEDVAASENGMPAKVTSLEKYSLPVKLTIGVDNGPDSPAAMSHYRTGLTELVKALPPDVEVTLVTMAPQPRTVVKPTTDQEEILRGVTRFGPDDQPARFTDTLVEFAQRIDKDVKDKKLNYMPMLVIVSTTAAEATSYQLPDVEKAMKTIAVNGGRLSVAMTTTRVGDASAQDDLNNGRQAIIAIPLVKATRGRYEPLATSSRLQTLLPEFGKGIASVHRKQTNQYKAVIERPAGATGALNNFDVRLTRPGLQGSVSGDGRFTE